MLIQLFRRVPRTIALGQKFEGSHAGAAAFLLLTPFFPAIAPAHYPPANPLLTTAPPSKEKITPWKHSTHANFVLFFYIYNDIAIVPRSTVYS